MRGVIGRRAGLARLVLPLCGLGYLLFRQDHPFTAVDQMCALAVLVASLAGGYLPLSAVLTGSAALAVAHHYGTATPVMVKVGVSLALFELALRRWGRPTVVGAVTLTTAAIVDRLDSLPSALYSSAVMVAVPVLLAAFISSLDREACIARERAEEAEHRRDLAARATRMTERTAIARELHDMVAHHMASLALRVGVARHVIPVTDPRVAEVLDEVYEGATSALADLRRLLTALRDPGEPERVLTGPAELPTAVDALIESARQTGLQVESTIGPELSRLDTVRGLTVLRLVQEGLTNVAKHAGPDAAVQIHTAVDAAGDLLLDLSNEPGTAPVTSIEGAGHGLLGMRERVELVGGRLEAGPDRGGWRLAAVLPKGDWA